jgi:RNA polymerase sigma-70 factor, ECF subfamily
MVLEDGLTLTDEDLVARVLSGETGLYELLMRRHNQRLFRTIRSVIADDEEAQDVLQDAWVRAYEHLDQFEHRARFATWVSRIALYNSLARARAAKRYTSLEEEGENLLVDSSRTKVENPETQAMRSELGRTLQSAVDELPETYRSVFVLREVEGLSTLETAACLDLSEEAVKTRLHRSRALLRQYLEAQAGAAVTEMYPFLGRHCDLIVAQVMQRIHFTWFSRARVS